jgi:hypothetical protein
MNWHKITTEQANEIIAANKKNTPIASLEEYALDLVEDTAVEFENVVGQDSLTRFDSPKRPKKRRNNRRKGNAKNSNTTHAKKKTPANANANAPKKGNAKTKAKPNQNNRRKNTKRKPQNAKNNQK